MSARGESANAVWQKFSENREDKRFEYSPPENLSVTEPDWNTLKQTIRRSHILQMPPVALDENGFPIGGADGDSWIIESCVDGQYHFASRWTPYGHEYDSFRSVGKAMIISGGSRHQTVAIQVID